MTEDQYIKEAKIDVQEWLISEGYSPDEAYTAEELLEAVQLFQDTFLDTKLREAYKRGQEEGK